MKLPVLKIGNLVAQVPIIQGGMAIRLSTARLAAAVANEGGIGLIAASGMEEQELRTEIRLARKLTNGKGIIGINCMVAARAFKNLIVTAAQEGVDLIVAGAGFSRDIFAVGREYNVAVVPIVSSVKLAKISEKLGASAIVVEGTEAGGHLGTQQSIKEILPDIVKAVNIPVIAAGGATCGQDIVDLLNLGEESNGARFLKEMYLRMSKEDVVQIDSPVGYKGRSIRSPFAQLSLEGKAPLPVVCDACLKHCTHQFCIIRALSRAQQGDVETGLIFTGANMWKIHEILPVKEIFRRIKEEIEAINN